MVPGKQVLRDEQQLQGEGPHPEQAVLHMSSYISDHVFPRLMERKTSGFSGRRYYREGKCL